MIKVMHNIPFIICLVYSIITLFSCSEDIIEENTSDTSKSDVLTLIVSTENQTASRVAYDGLHAEFEEGDAIGVYVIDNGTVTASNVKFTLNNGKWTSLTNVKYSLECRYLAYYPYTASPYPVNSNGADKDVVFSQFISDSSNKFHYADQSTKKKFDASDLMVSEGTTSSPKTIAFCMEHKKSLARITGSTDVCTYGDGRSDLIPAIITFGGNLPYFYEGEYRYLMKAGTETEIGGMKLKGTSGHYVSENIHIRNIESVEYETTSDGGNTWNATLAPPSWLTLDLKEEGSKKFFIASTTDEKTTGILKATYVSKSEYMLRNAPEVVLYRDLSLYNNDGTYRGTRTTANCYLVHAPGTYSLPMVYGNAIVDDNKNEDAYKATVSGANIMPTLVNNNDEPINDSYVWNIQNAKLLWQDSKDLITDVHINGNWLRFTVNRETITEGNAVVAAIDMHGNIAWSWHIWITPETLSETRTINTGSHEYNIAPVNVGWVKPKGACYVYEGSRCRVKVYQTDGSTVTFEVKQRDGTEMFFETKGYSPFFQWGRKDPFVSGDASTNTSYVAYDADGNQVKPYLDDSLPTIGYGIKHPMALLYDSGSATLGTYNTSHHNYWDINQNGEGNISTPTKKTVYDPCPPGHCLPTGNLYYYMGNGGSRSDRNYDTTFSTKTWTLNGENVTFNGLGNRYFQTSDTYVTGVYYWSASASGTNGVGLKADSRYWRYNTMYRSYGCPVRSVLEE